MIGAVEAGGTKIICAVGSGPGERVRARATFATTDDPARVLTQIAAWFESEQRNCGPIAAFGVASFGPIDLDKQSPTYGYITSTPKPGWRDTNIVGRLQGVFPGVPVGFDTDVNGAALGEFFWGRARDIDDFVYITIGTGVGAGAMIGGHLAHGLVHPEMGHIRLPRLPGDTFAGVCRYHGACWEGLCSGPAMLARTGIPAERLPEDHAAWGIEAAYVGLAISNLVCVLSPRKVILGGSVRKGGLLGEDRFFLEVRRAVTTSLNGYVVSPNLDEGIGEYVVAPGLGDDAGICGAIALGLRAGGFA